MSFEATYEKLFSDIGLPLEPKDGCTEESLLEAEARLGIRLPKALRAYYAKTGNHPLNQAHNRLLSLSKIDFADDHLVFLEENQCISLWGLPRGSLRTDNPMVSQGENGKAIVWSTEGLAVSDFLELCVYWQAACGGLEFSGSATDLSAEILGVIEKHWTRVRTHNRMSFYLRPGQILVMNDEGQGVYSLLAAGTTLESFEDIDDRLGIEWDWSIIDELEVEDVDDVDNDDDDPIDGTSDS